MRTPTISSLTLILIVILSRSSATFADKCDDFLECLKYEFHNYSSISNLVHTKTNSSFVSILRFSIHNLRFATKNTPKPQVIITPQHESQIPPLILCARKSEVQIRTRSGGHDFEGLSYVSEVPFVIVDLVNLSEITVDVEHKTAWVGSGATLGSLYYKIAEKSPILGFPAGLCPSVGVGGHFSGGGYGALTRKYGLSADHVIDARIVDVNGRILDRESMGEDLFWAIRGGGGASFGVIVAWKVQLVDVPEKVTVFTVNRQNATQIIHRWQYVAPETDRDLLIGINVNRVNATINASFFSLFLGGVDRLMSLMQEHFPELGLVREDCIETSWIKSVLHVAYLPMETPLEVLLSRIQPNNAPPSYIKIKSNYVQKPIPASGLEGVWRFFYEAEAEATAFLFLYPYGGRMAEISESATPFPHRAGNLYSFNHYISWGESEGRNSDRYISWSRRLENYMTPYVSRSPRSAYLNYRDLDIGVNNVVGDTSYSRASVWGKKYFGHNFDRLVRVKIMVDPQNFFRNEQSIPNKWKKNGRRI
ncbi:tetrahydroberberine oxidase-like [Salvia miltiorrhiza]|uniref:tetrahydroberberine oxidase-like n=1 Tax=Salvia miltiorrhiza TaxID=226208 RepID=UPI0025AC5E27|nr:tetrahydroberberine oxidase-like [Salvia miltiorrhiza]